MVAEDADDHFEIAEQNVTGNWRDFLRRRGAKGHHLNLVPWSV